MIENSGHLPSAGGAETKETDFVKHANSLSMDRMLTCLHHAMTELNASRSLYLPSFMYLKPLQGQ